MLLGAKASRRPIGLLLQENLENRYMNGKQMTANKAAGAPSNKQQKWKDLNWPHIEAQVKRLQMRIAKATREKRFGKVKALQWVLTHSHYAKLLAVKRVTSNRGAKTPGVDGEIWSTGKKKVETTLMLRRRGYQAQPLRRIYIPKKSGAQRPLGIPTMKDRAMQALHLLGLEPVAEITADPNSYGFRPNRSTQDAIEQCFCVLSRRNCAQWILEADVRSCFDRISHEWLINHVVMDTQILKQWLRAGFLEKQQWYPTEQGAPQGGIASPTLANIAFNGLEAAIKAAAGKREKVNIVRYADDFIVTGASHEALERLKPVIQSFLDKRGLELSPEKTKITSIYAGFDFLGFNVRKYHRKLLIKPSKSSIKKIHATIREVARKSVSISTINFIKQLNPKLRGWGNYYRHVVSSRAFAAVDNEVFHAVWKWAKRRHPRKSSAWIRHRYFHQSGGRNWMFFTKTTDKNGVIRPLNVVMMNAIPIKRHVKIKANATPYDSSFKEYFEQRKQRKMQSSSGHWARHIAPKGFH